jgi:hypothetical protein
MEIALALALIALLIGVTYFLARRRELTCPKCKSKRRKKTGNKRVVDRKRRALIAGPLPYHDYEYNCEKCGNLFWSPIESMWGD